MEEKDGEGAVCTFFKKSNKGSRTAAARRKKESSSSSDDDGAGVVKKERKKATGMVAGSSGARKKQKTDTENGGSDSDDVESLLVMARADGKVYGTRDVHATTEVEANKPVDKSKQQVSSFIKPGPRTGTSNIRITQRFDYQPDVCKDYKETGYCGFGDTCKFLHDRSDYKTGWQLEREWESGHYGKRENLAIEDSSEESEEELPFACFICREPFDNPVVTKCQHYFCMKCAVDHYKRDKKCFVCNAQTNGIFNSAKDLIAKIKKKEQQKEAKETNL